MKPLPTLILFVTLLIGGAMIESIFSRFYRRGKAKHPSHFYLSRYLYLMSMPLLAMIVLYLLSGMTPIRIFIIFALLGPVLEWLIGFAYESVVGQKLWTYHRFAISGYTSFLTMPIWGLGAIIFYYLAASMQ